MKPQEQPQELLAVDPFYEHAVQAVDSIMEQMLRSEQIAAKCRAHMHRYHGASNRLRFMDAFRAELTAFISEHRSRCPRVRRDCPQEHDYATAITIVRDELEVLNPAIAARSEALSFNQAEANEVITLLNELKLNMQAVASEVSVIKLSEQFSYEDMMDLLEDMNSKLPYGKPDWFDLFKVRISKVAMDETIRSTVVEPLLIKLRAIVTD